MQENKTNFEAMCSTFCSCIEKKKHDEADTAIREQQSMMKENQIILKDQQALLRNQQASILNIKKQLGKLAR